MLASVGQRLTVLASVGQWYIYSTIEHGTVLDSAGKCDIDTIGIINYYIKL